MQVDYFNCPCCGFEAMDIFIVYSGRTANNEWYICPECKEESISVEIEE